MAQKQKFNDPKMKKEIIQWMLDRINKDGMNKTKAINAALDELKRRGVDNPPSVAALRSWLPVTQRRGKGKTTIGKTQAKLQRGKMDIDSIKRQMESFREQAIAALREKADTITRLQSELDIEIDECAELFGESIDDIRSEIE